MIEQQQVLTTHNLASLFDALGLADALGARLPELARACFAWICRELQIESGDWRSRLQSVKNAAYAWRQMVFYLALSPREETAAFVPWAESHLAEQRPAFEARLAPAVRGLALVAAGGAFGADGRGGQDGNARRLLGWTLGRHWLFGASPPS